MKHPCPNCNGFGGAGITDCCFCNGTGKVKKKLYKKLTKKFQEEKLRLDNALIRQLSLMNRMMKEHEHN